VIDRPILLLAAPLATALAAGAAAVALPRSGASDLWGAAVSRHLSGLLPQIQALGLDRSRVDLGLKLWGVAMIAVVGVMAALGQWLLAVPAAILVWAAPRIVVEAMVKRRRNLLRDQMVGATVALANATRAGLALAQGLEAAAAETPEPLRSEFRQVVNEYRRGRPLPEAIAAAKRRLGLESFTLFASALLVCLERGGRLSESLEAIARSLQENQRLERKLEAETASGRAVVAVLAIFPIAFLGLFGLINPEGTALMFSTLIGQAALVVVALLIFGAAAMARRILAIDI